jgi:hypothetical protein
LNFGRVVEILESGNLENKEEFRSIILKWFLGNDL